MSGPDYSGYEIEEVGKEYISKCLGIVKVTENFVKNISDSIFVIKSTLNIIKPELENIQQEEILKEITAFIEVIKEKAGEILRYTKEAKVKILKLSHISFVGVSDKNIREQHTETYKHFYNTMVGLIDNFLKDIVDQLYDSIKHFNRLAVSKEGVEEFIRWYSTIFRSLKESVRFLKLAIKNNNVIKNHIEKYRKNLINNVKTQKVLDEVNKARPIGLMRSGGRIKTEELKPGNIFSNSLYTKDSELVKDSYIPFTEDDIKELSEKNIKFLYKHNNLDKHLKPSEHHIAIVDDDKTFTDMLKEHLKDLQFNVIVFNHAEQALKEIPTSIPDIILLDVKMPGLNGIEFLRYMQNRQKRDVNINIPVIMITAWANEELIRECIKLGAYDYIVKPFSIDDLLTKITAYLHIKEA